MTPEFSEAFEPLFLLAIELLDRIDQRTAPPPSNLRDQLHLAYEKAERELGNPPGAGLAKKAMIYWIDEMMIAAHWEGQDWWNNNKLETKLFNSNDRYRLFYEDAQEASKLTDKSALEVFYLCVVFGFRGLYADTDNEASRLDRDMLRLPPTLEEWIQETVASIQLAAPPEVEGLGESIEGVYPLEGPGMLVWSAFFGIVLAVIAGLFVYFVVLQPL